MMHTAATFYRAALACYSEAVLMRSWAAYQLQTMAHHQLFDSNFLKVVWSLSTPTLAGASSSQ
jgi:hypothetical protein